MLPDKLGNYQRSDDRKYTSAVRRLDYPLKVFQELIFRIRKLSVV